MGSAPINPKSAEPELNLLLSNSELQEPLWRSLARELDDFFFPKKLPPLKLESKPEPVRDIWGFYDNKKNGALGSTAVHILIAAIVVAGTIIAKRVVAAPSQRVVVTLVAPEDFPRKISAKATGSY